MNEMRKIFTGKDTEKHIQSILMNYPGKVIWIHTLPVKQDRIRSVGVEQLEQITDFERIAVEAVWNKEDVSCPYDVREKLESFLMPYEKQEGVVIIFDDVSNTTPWYVPYILENTEYIKADIIITMKDIASVERCYLENYMLLKPDRDRFKCLISMWDFEKDLPPELEREDKGSGKNKISPEEVKELLENGHSTEELIELFGDKQEQHNLFVNSGLVRPDFENIIRLLKIAQAVEEKNK